MFQSFRSAIVRIKTADDIIVGAGFLVAERIVLTCIHVIWAALERPVQTMPPDSIHLDFPLSTPKQKLIAKAIYWKSKQPDGTGDIAGLEITNKPIGIQPVKLVVATEIWGNSFRAFGFPPGHDDGIWASGEFRDRKANGHIQIEAVKTPGFAVDPGFSGSPVWDNQAQAVIGMVATAERRAVNKAAFIIPAKELLEAIPSVDNWVETRSELAILQVAVNQALQKLDQSDETLPKVVDNLWEITKRVEKLSQMLIDSYSQTVTGSHHLTRLQYVTELVQANKAVIRILRMLLRPFRNDGRFQPQASLVTEVNRLEHCLSQLQHYLT